MRASQRGFTLAELLVVVCIIAIFSIVAVTSMKKAAWGEKYIILEVPAYTSGNSPWVEFNVREKNSEPFKMRVPVERLDVQLRDDESNDECTQLKCFGGDSMSCQCSRATILASTQEDVAAWQAEVDCWKKLRMPPHVVPKPQ